MRNPDRLEVVKRANELAELVYQATATFPASEQHGLIDQLRRASVSIGSNITEGCGRSTDRAFLGYLQSAMASANEVEFQTRFAAKVGMGNRAAVNDALTMSRRVKQMLAKLTVAVRKKLKD